MSRAKTTVNMLLGLLLIPTIFVVSVVVAVAIFWLAAVASIPTGIALLLAMLVFPILLYTITKVVVRRADPPEQRWRR